MRHHRGDYTPIGEENEDAASTSGAALSGERDDPHAMLISSAFAPSVEERIRWDHIQNLDEFFTLVYEYHQRHGFLCILVERMFSLFQFVFVVIFATFLISCVDYRVLFATPTSGNKTHISDAVLSFGQCTSRLSPGVVFCLIVAAFFWLILLVRTSYQVIRFWEINMFYRTALNITNSELPNMTWHNVLSKLLEVQKEMQLCVHKTELNELDVYNRILRFTNYKISMINKGVLPVKLQVPLIGTCVYLTTGYLMNIGILLFFGPWALFENYWHVKVDVKQRDKRKVLAAQLSSRILKLGLANLLLSPFILLWQISYSFFKYTELLKREPGKFGSRRWSNFGKLFLRHFNELDHEFNTRLNRAHSSASKYLNIFSSRLVVIVCKNIMFIAGAMLAVLIVLGVIDEDTLQVAHVVTIIAGCSIVVTVCRTAIPDENLVWCPETLLLRTLADIHYMPDHWKGQAHTNDVRIEFAELFQYRAVHVVEELLSPLLTPLVMIFWLRPKAEDIIDFMRNFTVEVPGVGDICSFAQLNLRKHGHPMWMPPHQETEAGDYERTEYGKVELSLMHFHLTNPQWQPPSNSRAYLDAVRQQVQRDTSMMVGEHAGTMGGGGATLALASMFSNSGSGLGLLPEPTSMWAGNCMAPLQRSLLTSLYQGTDRLVGGVSTLAGPAPGHPHAAGLGEPEMSAAGVVPAMQESIHFAAHGDAASHYRSINNLDGGTLELMTMNMNMSTLYMHELHHRRRQQQQHHQHQQHHQLQGQAPPSPEFHHAILRIDSPPSSGSPQPPSSPLPSLARISEPPALNPEGAIIT